MTNNKYFISIILIIGVFSLSINADDSYQCVPSGSVCTINALFSPPGFNIKTLRVSAPRVYINCEQSNCAYINGGGVCTNYTKLGEACNYNGQCGPSVSCSSNICANNNYLIAGESCTSSAQCSNNLVCGLTGKCELAAGTTCSYNSQCSFGNYCTYTSQSTGGGAYMCVPFIKAGQSCSNGQCNPGLICNSQDICENSFSITTGGSCSEFEQCQWNKTETCVNGICTKVTPTQGDCTTATNLCNTYFEYCNYNTKSCKQINSITAECQNSYSSYYDCINTNKCFDVLDNGIIKSPSTCALTQCGKSFCGIQSCSNSETCQTNEFDSFCNQFASSSDSKASTPTPTPTPTEPSSSNILISSNILLILFIILNIFIFSF